MDEIAFVVSPDLIAIGVVVVPFVVELLTKQGVDSRVKKHVATAIVALVVLGSLALDIWVSDTVDVGSAGAFFALVPAVFAQFGIIRVAVEGGHQAMDALERSDRRVSALLFPGVGLGNPKEEA